MGRDQNQKEYLSKNNQRVSRLSMQGWRRRAIYAILEQKPYNFTTNTLKAYLSAQASSLSAFVIHKTHTSGQKPHGRQLNIKVYGSESAIFRILLSFLLRPHVQQRYLKNSLSAHRHFSDAYHSAELYDHSVSSQLQIHPGQRKLFTTLCGCCQLLRMPFSNFVHMRTRSLIPRSKTTIIGLEAILAHKRNHQRAVQYARLAWSFSPATLGKA